MKRHARTTFNLTKFQGLYHWRPRCVDIEQGCELILLLFSNRKATIHKCVVLRYEGYDGYDGYDGSICENEGCAGIDR